MNEASEAADLAFVFGIFALVALLLVVVIWQLAATYRARAAAAREDAYRKLAEEAASTQQEIIGALDEIRPRIAAIESMLREVE